MTTPASPHPPPLLKDFDQLSVEEKSRFLDAALTDDQLEVTYLTRRARRDSSTPGYAEESERLQRQSDPETCRAFVQRRAARSWVDHLRSCGIDDGLIACAIARGHLAAGEPIDDALAAVRAAGIAWTPSTVALRDEAVVRGMLADGIPAEYVRHVLAGPIEGAA